MRGVAATRRAPPLTPAARLLLRRSERKPSGVATDVSALVAVMAQLAPTLPVEEVPALRALQARVLARALQRRPAREPVGCWASRARVHSSAATAPPPLTLAARPKRAAPRSALAASPRS